MPQNPINIINNSIPYKLYLGLLIFDIVFEKMRTYICFTVWCVYSVQIMITKAHSKTEKFIYNNYIILITGLMALEVSPYDGIAFNGYWLRWLLNKPELMDTPPPI